MNNMTMGQNARVNQAMARAAMEEYIERDRRKARVASMYGLGVCAAALGVAVVWVLVILAVGLLSGCGTLGKPDPGLVQLVARDAGFIGAQAALTYNPSFRAELELTRQALQGFVAAGKGDVTNLQGILQQHLPGGLGGTTNSMVVVGTGGILLYNAAGALVAKVDKGQLVSTYAQPIAMGLLQGISQALGSYPDGAPGKPSSRSEIESRDVVSYNRRE